MSPGDRRARTSALSSLERKRRAKPEIAWTTSPLASASFSSPERAMGECANHSLRIAVVHKPDKAGVRGTVLAIRGIRSYT